MWHHAPVHHLEEAGAYCVTAGTLHKEGFFQTPKQRDLLQELLFTFAERYKWFLQAWAIFTNHYHFVASSENSKMLRRFISDLHSASSRELNKLDGTPGRKVWFQYWDTHLTFQGSYLARLRYVHENPVHHGLVLRATAYPWCSANWFETHADSSFYREVSVIKIDCVKIVDDF